MPRYKWTVEFEADDDKEAEATTESIMEDVPFMSVYSDTLYNVDEARDL